MDQRQFDQWTRNLGRGASRRGILRGMAGGLAAALGLRSAGSALAQQERQALCHATDDPANPWVVIDVASPSWGAHRAHGDHPRIDCCYDEECSGYDTCGGGDRPGACGCTPRSTCAEGESGMVPDGCGGELFCGCGGNYILSGPDGIDAPFGVDDDLLIFRNGALVYFNFDRATTELGPIPLTAAPGDRLRFTAYNTVGGCQFMEPVTIHCADGSGSQLGTEGVSCPESGCDCTFPPDLDTPFFIDEVVLAI